MSAQHTPGPWMVATSNSWRRIVAQGMTPVCEPIKQNDGHPDLYFRNGGADGPDARLIAAAPELLELALFVKEHPNAASGMGTKSHTEWLQMQHLAAAAISKIEGTAA